MYRRRPVSSLRSLSPLALLLAFSACTAQRPSESALVDTTPAAAEATAITLGFAWPDGLTARVRTTSVKSQTLGPQSRTQDMVADYTMKAAQSERGTAIVFGDFQIDRPGASEEDRMVETVLAYRPGLLVDQQGKLTDVIGLEGLRQLLTPLQEQMATAPEELQRGLQAVAQTVTSEEYLTSRAGAEWSNIIGSWVGKTLTPGKVETKSEDTPASGFVDHPIATEVTLSIARIDACIRQQPRACVRLRLTREPQPEALREAMLPNLDKMLGVEDWGPEGPPDLRNVSATSQLIVDTEPDTLVPHRIEALRVFSLELFRPSGAIQVRDSNRVTSTYQYD